MKPDELTQIRERLGMSQGEFAEKVGVARQTVNRWENEWGRDSGMRPVYERIIRQLAKRKGVAA